MKFRFAAPLACLALQALCFSGCNSQGPSEKFVDSCNELPETCSGVYSGDGKYLAFLAPASGTADLQVYRVRLDLSPRKPELVSLSEQGEVASGKCHSLEFLEDNSLVFNCAASNLDGHLSADLRYIKTGDAPLIRFEG